MNLKNKPATYGKKVCACLFISQKFTHTVQAIVVYKYKCNIKYNIPLCIQILDNKKNRIFQIIHHSNYILS